MTTLDEAVRFAEEYGYNRWSDARDELSYLRAQLQAAQEERDDATDEAVTFWKECYDHAMAEIERLRGALRNVLTAIEPLAFNDIPSRVVFADEYAALTPEGTPDPNTNFPFPEKPWPEGTQEVIAETDPHEP